MENEAELFKELKEAKERENLFYTRHGFPNQTERDSKASASQAHKEWVKVVEHEYNKVSKSCKVMCDSPMARKMFILGYIKAEKKYKEGK